jgi:hypothetical protein
VVRTGVTDEREEDGRRGEEEELMQISRIGRSRNGKNESEHLGFRGMCEQSRAQNLFRVLNRSTHMEQRDQANNCTRATNTSLEDNK